MDTYIQTDEVHFLIDGLKSNSKCIYRERIEFMWERRSIFLNEKGTKG